MNYLRCIFAITLIAVFSVTIVLESAAHASTNDCMGENCHTHASVDVHGHGDTSLADRHSHEQDGAEHECCDQLSCQTVALMSQHLITSPASFGDMMWGKVDQLMALVHHSNLDRPPNL